MSTDNDSLRSRTQFLGEYAFLLAEFEGQLPENDFIDAESFLNGEMPPEEENAFRERRKTNPTLDTYTERLMQLNVRLIVRQEVSKSAETGEDGQTE